MNIIRPLKENIKKILWYVYRIKPLNNKKIVLDCFDGRGYSDNPKYIVDALLKIDPSYDIVCLVTYDKFDIKDIVPNYIRKVKFNSKEAIYELATAKFWIGNMRKQYFTAKRKNQIYIQTWHGGTGPKLVEKDVEDKLSASYVKFAKIDSKNADLILSSSKWQTMIDKRSFWYDGEIMELGMPKNDPLLNTYLKQDIDKKYRQYFNLNKDTKVLLYAPTFRKKINKNIYSFDFKECLKILEKKYNCPWVVLIKLHPNVADKSDILEYNNYVINASSIADTQELEIFSDILITDYSSMMFDFAIMDKICLLFCKDYEDYISERGFAFSLEDTAFPIARTNKELLDIIDHFDKTTYFQKLAKMNEEFGIIKNNNSSKEVATWIIERSH